MFIFFTNWKKQQTLKFPIWNISRRIRSFPRCVTYILFSFHKSRHSENVSPLLFPNTCNSQLELLSKSMIIFQLLKYHVYFEGMDEIRMCR